MYGWRARIGFIAPSRMDTFMYEFYKIVPEGVVAVLSGFTVFSLVPDDLERAYKKIEESAMDLAKVGVDYIVAGGGPVFNLIGKGSDREAIKRIEAITNIPATTSVTAEIDSLKKLAVKKIVVASPYTEERNRLLKEYLEYAGFTVLRIKGLGIELNSDIAKVPPYEVYRLAKSAFVEAPEAEGISIACPRWPAIGSIEKLEQDLGVPVISSTTSKIWKAFDHLRIKEPIKGYGKLLETP